MLDPNFEWPEEIMSFPNNTEKQLWVSMIMGDRLTASGGAPHESPDATYCAAFTFQPLDPNRPDKTVFNPDPTLPATILFFKDIKGLNLVIGQLTAIRDDVVLIQNKETINDQ